MRWGMARAGADDNGGVAAQEDAEAFLFNGGMEAADDAVTGVAPLGGLVVGAENHAAGASGGAEQRRDGLGQKVQVAESCQLRRGVGA